eukprot:GEMP01005049.1.p1 GENE.GEMP01005049.1~~GEMP01005049.1.p1  ORF type:complete len:632 (+),score=154.74 GEMP01005049.1:29-1924(+)
MTKRRIDEVDGEDESPIMVVRKKVKSNGASQGAPPAKPAKGKGKGRADPLEKQLNILRGALENPSYQVEIRQMLLSVLDYTLRDLKEDRHEFQHTFVAMYEETIERILKSLCDDLSAKEYKVQHSDEIKAQQEERAVTLAQELTVLTCERREKDIKFDQLENAVAQAVEASSKEQSLYEEIAEKQSALFTEKKTITDTLELFNEVCAKPDKKKEGKVIRAMKAHLNCEESMIQALPGLLAHVDRGSFAEMGITMAIETFTKRIEALSNDIKAVEDAMAAKKCDMDKAESFVALKTQEKDAMEAELDEMRALETQINSKLKETKKNVAQHDKNVVQWNKDFTKAIAAEKQFRTTVKEAFIFLATRTELKESVPSTPELDDKAQEDALRSTTISTPATPEAECVIGGAASHNEPISAQIQLNSESCNDDVPHATTSDVKTMSSPFATPEDAPLPEAATISHHLRPPCTPSFHDTSTPQKALSQASPLVSSVACTTPPPFVSTFERTPTPLPHQLELLVEEMNSHVSTSPGDTNMLPPARLPLFNAPLRVDSDVGSGGTVAHSSYPTPDAHSARTTHCGTSPRLNVPDVATDIPDVYMTDARMPPTENCDTNIADVEMTKEMMSPTSRHTSNVC